MIPRRLCKAVLTLGIVATVGAFAIGIVWLSREAAIDSCLDGGGCWNARESLCAYATRTSLIDATDSQISCSGPVR